eukprot:Lithocolla_globosa_v1_NODE_11850_length_479_cov_2.846698.p4 type:complete len:103 gc:universal NODE_11850_length_479_cov_2.846698:101-409(+)
MVSSSRATGPLRRALKKVKQRLKLPCCFAASAVWMNVVTICARSLVLFVLTTWKTTICNSWLWCLSIRPSSDCRSGDVVHPLPRRLLKGMALNNMASVVVIC